MKKLRLLITEYCPRSCEGCCNKDWDLGALPVIGSGDFSGYDEILLTGGEPLLSPWLLGKAIDEIREEAPEAHLYLYTAKTDDWGDLLSWVERVDGVCITLHEQEDVEIFYHLDTAWIWSDADLSGKSLRLNVFDGLHFDAARPKLPWKIKDKIVWIKDCPLPREEVFAKYHPTP